jgi:hypothetical protein
MHPSTSILLPSSHGYDTIAQSLRLPFGKQKQRFNCFDVAIMPSSNSRYKVMHVSGTTNMYIRLLNQIFGCDGENGCQEVLIIGSEYIQLRNVEILSRDQRKICMIMLRVTSDQHLDELRSEIAFPYQAIGRNTSMDAID